MSKQPSFIVHTPAEIVAIRQAARAAAEVREKLPLLVQPGMSTLAIDQLAGALIAATGGHSAFLGYRGYPAQICISVNDEVVHGIGRADRIIKTGDVLSLDIGVELNGGVGDNATTVVVGGVSTPDIDRLVVNTEKALLEGLKQARPGNYIRDISAAIEKVARAARLGVVREYVGHGCGTRMHEPPEVPNFVCAYRGPRLVPGMILAVEPMFNLGSYKVYTEADQWTVRTADGSVSAHFEHMVLVTENEPEILTWLKM